jgi:hypothetical protein
VATFLFADKNGEVGWEPEYPAFDLSQISEGAEPAAGSASTVPAGSGSAAPAASSGASRPEEAARAPKTSVPRTLRAAILEPEFGSTAPPTAAPASIDSPVVAPPAPPIPPAPLETPVLAPPNDAAVEAQPADAAVPFAARPIRYETPTDRRPKRRFFLPLMGWILLCIAAAVIYELWSFGRVPHWAPLHLNAQVSGNAIDVAWDQTARAVRDATQGVLTVIDSGGAEKRVPLGAQALHAGHYRYVPAAGGGGAANVLFRLEVTGGNESAGDSLRLITVAPPAPVVAKNAAPPQQATADRSADREVPAAEVRPANLSSLPEPLREIHPNIPPGIRARIQERVVVPVEVKVTASGRVASAAPRGSGDALYHYLADRSKQAARQWRFSPARAKNGKPVAAARTVYFVFTRPD